jgi:hypothetical protein
VPTQSIAQRSKQTSHHYLKNWRVPLKANSYWQACLLSAKFDKNRLDDAEFSDASEEAMSAMSNEGCTNEYTATLPVAADREPKRMMIREGVLLPECAHIETLSYSAEWRSVVKDDSFAIDRKLRAAGWQFFFVAGELKVIEPGWGASTIRRGINRILARGGKRNLNSMEITQVAAARFLGIPYVSVRAFSYHIQKQPVLQSNAERSLAQNDADWACKAFQ